MYSLEKITAALELLGNPQGKLKCIHVAGTNGKGSVCAMLAAILQEAGVNEPGFPPGNERAGYKIGLYTSPHIYDYTERIKINGVPIPQEEFEHRMAEFDGSDLTEFEALTALMFKYFADNKVDVVVLETGLGGRLDATNVIKTNLCAVITSISLDHTELLGTTIEEITREKEGIIKEGCPVVRKEETDKREEYESPLKGKHQEENLALVLAVLEKVFPHITPETIREGLKKTHHPARFQIINENLIVDACHNPGGAAALRASLDLYFPDRPRRFVFGCLKNKDYDAIAEVLFRPEDDIYYYEFSRQFDGGKKFEALDKLPQDDALVIVCGSIYMIKDIIPRSLLLSR
jgi:dihydrofolate synthase/folylpolyglutamate synthase